MTRLEFIRAYREELIATYSWAACSASRLDRYCDSVVAALNGRNTWNCEAAPALILAMRRIGLHPVKGKRANLAMLRALP